MIAATSREAFHQMMATGGATEQRVLIVSALRWHGDMTRHDISDLTGICLQSVCARCHELIHSGHVEKTSSIEYVQHANGRRVPREKLAAVFDLVDQALSDIGN